MDNQPLVTFRRVTRKMIQATVNDATRQRHAKGKMRLALPYTSTQLASFFCRMWKILAGTGSKAVLGAHINSSRVSEPGGAVFRGPFFSRLENQRFLFTNASSSPMTPFLSPTSPSTVKGHLICQFSPTARAEQRLEVSINHFRRHCAQKEG